MVKYGTDTDRVAWAKAGRAKCKSLKQRTEMLDTLCQSEFSIDKELGYSIYQRHSIDLTDLNREVDKLILNSDMAFRKKAKPFMKLDFFTPQDLDINSPFIQLALNKDIVSAVSKYMGHVPVLYSTAIYYSRPFHDPHRASQLFHCDWEDTTCTSVFINIRKVSENEGPLVVISANKSQEMRDKLKYTYGPDDYYVSDDKVSEMCSPDDLVEITGPAGAMYFIDNCKCFHQGSRVQGPEPRIVVLMKYLSPSAFNADLTRTRFEHIANNNLDEISKLVLSNK